MSRLVARAESWERAYQAFESVNFAAFDYATVKRSLIDYIKLYFPETFNDYIESSELVAIIETFAYIAELMAYRVDVNANENFISTAQRKDSVLRLAKLVSYTASRPLPARGLVKITSVTTSETIIDANGSDLSNRTIRWNDNTNENWKDQFSLVMGRVLEQQFGTVGPTDRFQLQDSLFELYSVNTVPLGSGVFAYSASVNGQTLPMELVPVSRDLKRGIVERRPAVNAAFTLLFGQDGQGDGSEGTGFFCMTKQGNLQKFRTTFDGVTPNLSYDVSIPNVNDTDVWVNNVDSQTGVTLNTQTGLPYRKETTQGISGEWVQVDPAHAQNVIFNTNPKRNKYEIETRADSKIRVIFGDGEYADIPKGTFDIWVRSSVDQDVIVPQSSVSNIPVSFTYVDAFQRTQTFSFTFSLTSTLQNASAAETIDQVRSNAPAVYYSQDRMVNGEDYNVYPLQDASILKIRSVNRTFAGDSKYITWHDASSSYENVKIMGTDGVLYFQDKDVTEVTAVVNTDVLLSSYVEPLLSSTDIFLHLVGVGIAVRDVRRSFGQIERSRLSSTLTPPPLPVSVDLYFNFATNEWFPIKTSDDVAIQLTSSGWPNSFIQYPLIKIRQISVFETRYNVSRLSRRIVLCSESTKFWNTNESSRVIDYDTARTNSDSITILKANVNYNRTGVLSTDYKFDVLGLESQDVGLNAGLPDITKVSIIPADTNGDGVPDGISIDTYPNVSGMAEIIKPKFEVDISGLAIGQPQPAVIGVVVNVPVFFTVNPATLYTSDVTVKYQNQLLVQGVDWKPADVSLSGPYVTSGIEFLAQGTGTTLGPTVTVDKVDVAITEYVYFSRSTTSDNWVAVGSTAETAAAYAADFSAGTNLWKRNVGKSNLNFVWLHHSPRYHLVDPSPTNIIDMFLITKGHFITLKRWLEDPLSPRPSVPTPLELRQSYGYLLDNKMVSDTVVLHPGKFKLIFGPKSAPSLRAQFKVIRTADRNLTDNQIKTTIVSVVRTFFDVSKWEFGETFYFTELSTAIHNALSNDISSVLLVPTLPQHQFGDLFQVLTREDEILYPDITVDNIEIVSGYTPTNLKQA